MREQQIRKLVQNMSSSQRERLVQRLLPHCEPQLTAHVVLRDTDHSSNLMGDESASAITSLRSHCSEHLSSAKQPRRFVLHEQLPTTSTGKLDRAALRSVAANQPCVAPGPVTQSTENPTLEKLLKIAGGLLNDPNLSPEDSFINSGGDSYLSIQMVAAVRREGFQLQPVDILDADSFRDLADRVDASESPAISTTQKHPRAPERSLVSDDERPVSSPEPCPEDHVGSVQSIRDGSTTSTGSICFAHSIGGTCGYAQHLIQHLNDDYSIYTTHQHATAHDDAGNRPVTIESLARLYVDQWLEKSPDGPRCLVTHCWGGLLAYEMANELRRRGHEIDALVIIDFGTELAYRYASAWNRRWDWFSGFRKRVGHEIRNHGFVSSLCWITGAIFKRLNRRGDQDYRVEAFNLRDGEANEAIVAHNFDLYFRYQIPAQDLHVHLLRTQDREHRGLSAGEVS
ncbi:MAG: thioesterase domain-containing protein, partial [Planctomycetota bacterium]